MRVFKNKDREVSCPGCGRIVQVYISANETNRPPRIGDLNICGDCNVVSVHTSLGLRPANRDEAERAIRDLQERHMRHVNN